MKAKVHRLLVDAAADALLSVFRDGYHADKVIERNLKNHKKWGARDRRFFAETVYDITRWWRKIGAELGHENWGQNPLAQADLSKDDVVQAVEHYLGREREPWAEVSAPHWSSAILNSLPDWLEERGQSELGAKWLPLMKALNQQAPVFLRANRLKCDHAELSKRLAIEGILSEPVAGLSDGLRLTERKNVFVTAAFKEGCFEMQDGGSQMIAPFLGAAPGERVVDACAGAGGKTLHLAALMKNKGKVLALDVSERKLAELKIRLRRSGVDLVEVRQIDSLRTIKRLEKSIDRLLLDVPCSGSGVWRRNPDSRWKLTSEALSGLHQTQREILKEYSLVVKPGGVLVYATCSVFPSENETQVQWFIKENSDFVLESEMMTSPATSTFDGFYAARLRRKV